MATFNRKKFFEGFRSRIDSSIEQEQVDGLTFLLDQMEADPLWKDIRHIAYALATTGHETAWSFQPVEEGYYLDSATRVKNFQKTLRYYPYFGRGYVQLTWETKKIPNYSKASKALGVDFVKSPHLVMVPKNAYKIMTLGMFQGWFTTKKLSDYISGSKCDYKNARKIINGLDKAALIAGYAAQFEQILKASKISDEGGITSATDRSHDIPPTSIETDLPQVPSSSDAQLTESAKIAENVQINQGDNASVVPPASFIAEDKTMEAPAKDGATATTAKTTILGIGVPASIYAIAKGIQDWVEKGFIDVKELMGSLLELIRNNVKYVAILIGLVVVVLVVKKIFKQITFLLQLYIAARPDLHNVTVIPADVPKPTKSWWQIWK